MLNKTIVQQHAHAFHGLAIYLLQDNLIDKETLQIALQLSEKQGLCLTNYLVKNNILSSEKIISCCVKHFSLPTFNLSNYNLDYLQDSIIKPELMCRFRILPLYHDDYSLHLGITDPTNHLALTTVRLHTDLHIVLMLISETEFDKILITYLRDKRLDNQLETTLSKISPLEDHQAIQVTNNNTENDEPISEFVNRLLYDAIDQHVSDIHIEPFAYDCRIRFRRDGLLHKATTIPLHLAIRIMTQLKNLSQLNIAEKRLPQDGRLQLPQFSMIDIRINTCPTLYGEKIVLRILNTKNVMLDIAYLGLNDRQKKLFISKLMKPQGLILVTGPTGSGKTITLYSALNYLNQIDKNISTVEDPIEIELEGINQININPLIGLDFTTILRSLLRQDPDIIMLGEIRDAQTAIMATQAAQTGHLVLATLHANNAVDAIMRLQSMDIPAYHYINAISLIIGQRLVRKLCNYCKQKNAKLVHLTSENNYFTDYLARGCDYCCQGYQGRVGIFELLAMTEELAEFIINKKTSKKKIYPLLQKQEYMTLWEAAIEKIKAGMTSLSDVIRVLGNPHE